VHEYSIVQAIIGRVEEEARTRGATVVHRVRVGIGELSGVDPALLATAFTTFQPRTICAHARLTLRTVAARWSCPKCELSIPAGAPLRCPACQGPARLLQGDELVLEQVELEVP
jgi:hydrogenase nickel incorporation protein HypA/HybF